MSSKWNRVASLGLLIACLAASAAHADLKDFTGTLEIQLLGVVLNSTPVSGQVDVAPDGSFDLPASLFVMSDFGSAAGISNYLYTGLNMPGHFAPSLSGFGGTMPINGSGYFSFITGKSISVPLFVVGGAAASTSVSGSVPSSSTGLPITGTLWGAPWQTGVASLSTSVPTSASPSATGTVSLAGTDARTASGDGTLQLVTPILFSLAGSAFMDGSHGSFGTLTFNFVSVPEAGSTLLMGTGLLGLLIAGCPRRRD